MISVRLIIPQLQLLNSKETQLNALQLIRGEAYLSYKTLQEENGSMGKGIESIMSTARVSVSFTHAEDTNITSNPHVNDSTYFQQ